MDSHKFRGISSRNAGNEAGLSYSTARNRILELKSGEFGGQLKYSLEEVELFADFVLTSADLEVPLMKQLLVNTVINYEKEKGEPPPVSCFLQVVFSKDFILKDVSKFVLSFVHVRVEQ